MVSQIAAQPKYQAGMNLCWQLLYALIDLELHSTYDPFGGTTPFEHLGQLFADIMPFPLPPGVEFFLNNFDHLFASSGGYDASYYSYMWSDVLSADAFASFMDARKEGGAEAEEAIGRRFADAFYKPGASVPPMEAWMTFMGREPKIAALLDYYGIPPP